MNRRASRVRKSMPPVRSAFLLLNLIGMLMTANPGHPDPPAEGRPAADAPEQWVLLVSNPGLWLAPGGERSERSLGAEASDEVTLLDQAVSGPEKTRWLEVSHDGSRGWLPEAWLAPLPLKIPSEDLARIGLEPVDRYNGIASDYVPPDLIETGHGYEAGIRYRLRREAAEALNRMIAAAGGDSIDLSVVSAYRSYEKQREIYLRKLDRSGWNQTTVAKPGHSEHQLGTAVDLTDGNEETLLEASFGETQAGRWLLGHAPEFGFAISYTNANSASTGYSPEPWHYRYVGIEDGPKRHRAARNP